MNFKELSQRCFRYFTGVPSNAFTNISANNGQFTSKVVLYLNTPFEEYVEKVSSHIKKCVQNDSSKEFETLYSFFDTLKYRDASDAEVYNDSQEVELRKTDKQAIISADIANPVFLYGQKTYRFTVKLNIRFTLMGKDDSGKDIVRIMPRMSITAQSNY